MPISRAQSRATTHVPHGVFIPAEVKAARLPYLQGFPSPAHLARVNKGVQHSTHCSPNFILFTMCVVCCGARIAVQASGEIYDGEWANDKMEGQGKMTMANGCEYEVSNRVHLCPHSHVSQQATSMDLVNSTLNPLSSPHNMPHQHLYFYAV